MERKQIEFCWSDLGEVHLSKNTFSAEGWPKTQTNENPNMCRLYQLYKVFNNLKCEFDATNIPGAFKQVSGLFWRTECLSMETVEGK